MTGSRLSRRVAVATGLAAPMAAAGLSGAQAQGSSAAQLVRRWLDDVVGNRETDLARLAHPDLVMELHGAGGHEDGRPRLIEGLPAVLAWFEATRRRFVNPVTIRIDQLIAEGDHVAVRGENIWTTRREGGETQRRIQAIGAFYTVRDGKIARIVRFTDRVGRAQA